MATMTLEEIQAGLIEVRRELTEKRTEAEVFACPLGDAEFDEQRQRIAELDDEMLVFAVLTTVKAAEEGCSRAGRQIATMCVGEMITRWVPGDVFDVARAMYEGEADA